MSAPKVARAAVLDAIPAGASAVIEASAGTGKTFTIAQLVVDLVVRSDAPIDKLLIVTFTERARNELATRVRREMENLIAGRGVPASDEAVRSRQFWTLDDEARKRLVRAVQSFDSVTLTTIHGFCQRVLRENAFTSGRLFDEQQIDGRAAFDAAFRRLLPTVIREPDAAPWLESALRGGRSPARLGELLWDVLEARGDVRPKRLPDDFLASFDALFRGADQIGAVDRALKAGGTHGSTRAAICDRLSAFAEEASRVDRRSPVDCLLAIERSRLLTLDVGKARLLPGAESAAAYLDEAARLAARACSPSAMLVHVLLPRVQAALRQRKTELGRYDFDDMLTLVDETLRGPEAVALAGHMRDRWHHVLIDEFQDTDSVQWSIFRHGFLRPFAGLPSRTVCLVGDPKQSIYRFRGADIETYVRACEEVVRLGGARVALGDNFRATPLLVAALNAIFDADAAEPIFSGSLVCQPVGCGRPSRALLDGDGRAVNPVCGVLVPSGDWLSSFGAMIAREAAGIAHPTKPWRLEGRALTYGDIFVLTRSGREGRVIGEALREAGVPYTYYKEEGLYQSSEAEDIRVVLSAVARPTDRSRRLAAWLTPFFGLSLTQLAQVKDLPVEHELVTRLDAWHALGERRDFGGLFEAMLRDSRLVRRQIFFDRGERAITNTMHVFEGLLASARTGHKTLQVLVDELAALRNKTRQPLDLEGNAQRLETEAPAVQIMTVHKSKGLEAPVVFIAGNLSLGASSEVHTVHLEGERCAWVGGMPPAVGKALRREEGEEDERLVYVALTRAMGRLVLPCPERSDKGGRTAWRRATARVLELRSEGAPSIAVEPLPAKPSEGSPPPVSWTPPVDKLVDRPPPPIFDELRKTRASAGSTSYTRMKSERADSPDDADAREEARSHVPSGVSRALGVALHEMLERVPLASFALEDYEQWTRREDVASVVAEALAVHGIDPSHRASAERLVWSAYATPVRLPDGSLVRLADADRVVREMDFAFPVLGGAQGDDPGRVRTYVRGSLDFLFEHEGRVFFVDWKSDTLATYDRQALHQHVRERYEDQVKLYSLAVAKLLRVADDADLARRFGGAMYCFLRGMNGEDGVWSAKAGWAELTAWDADLRQGGPMRPWIR